MKSSFNLLKELWPEITHAAVYLYNQTSCYFLNWKSSYELFHTHLAHWESVVIEEQKSQQAHLKVYDCKTYYMITDILKKINHLDQLKSRIWINYLVNYDSTNVYWIWNLIFNKMIWTRDIIFDEKMIFDEDIEAARLELKKTQIAQNMSLDQLAELLQWLNETETSESDKLNLDNDNTIMSKSDNTDLNDHNLDSHNSDENQLWNEELLKNYTLNVLNLLKILYFISLKTLLVLLTDVIYQIFNKYDKDSHNTDFESWKTIFAAERLAQSEKLKIQ